MSVFFSRRARQLESGSIAIMVLGFIFLCQPWSQTLFIYSVTVMLMGLVLFNIFSRIPQHNGSE